MSKKPLRGRVTFRLAKLMAPQLKWLLLCVACVVVVNAADLARPYIMKIVMDDFLVGRQAQQGLHSIAGLAWLFLCVIVAGAVSSFFQTRLINRIGQDILHGLRKQIFDHIHHMSLRMLDKYSSGRLITRATNDVETLSEFYSDVLVNLLRDVVLLAGIVVVMLRMDVRLALVGFSTIPLILLVTMLCRNKLRRNFIEVKRVIALINGFFAENVAGMRIVQAFNRQKDKLREFEALNREDYRLAMVQVTMNSVLRPVMEVINSLTIALLVLYGYNGITGGILEIGVLFAFTTYVKQFFDPINDLAEKYNTIQSALVSAERIYELLDDTDGLEDLQSGTYKGPVEGRVEFRDVWFAYEGEDWVLRGVSFCVERGQSVAFVGATGAGKTTIINLISRFYDVQKGQVLVDGVDVRDWRLSALRGGVAVVLQDVFLFSGSIAENVRVHADLPDHQVERALQLAMAEEFVQALPAGMLSEVTERGSTLSSGERQLLSFARAMAHNPAILVLDEATAHIDTNTEQLIQQSIASISKGRTAVFIAHRLSTIRHCDCIFVLAHGRLMEQGTHDELLEEEDGLYRALYDAQFEQVR